MAENGNYVYRFKHSSTDIKIRGKATCNIFTKQIKLFIMIESILDAFSDLKIDANL